jgi:hypothetical protein
MVLAMTQRRTSSPKHLTAPMRPFMAGETSEQGRSMPRRIGESGTMIFALAGHRRSRNGDFEAKRAAIGDWPV